MSEDNIPRWTLEDAKFFAAEEEREIQTRRWALDMALSLEHNVDEALHLAARFVAFVQPPQGDDDLDDCDPADRRDERLN